MECHGCGFGNKPGKKFCTKCGVRLLLKCPKCGSKVEETDGFCGQCGHDLSKPGEPPPIDYSQPQTYTPEPLAQKILTVRDSIEGERKLVTVLFTDVADYTSISERLDPEEVHRIMDGYFRILVDAVHRFEGTVDKFTGDGVMALFGAPVAHEDHAQRACHAALAIRKAIREYGEKVAFDCGLEFVIRVGLNSGPVIVGTIGDDLRMDYTAIGDTTNLASRMESMAEPGSVLVSGNTHKLARDYFEFLSLGKITIKGKEKPQEAYELVGPSEVETRIEAAAVKGLTRFVGRRKEMAILREASRKARAGSGQIVGILGDAGVGKSRLLLEFKKQVFEEDSTCLEGRCLHFGGTMPYLPILDIVKSYFDIQEGDKQALIKRKVRQRLSKMDEKLLGSLPSFHELLSVPVEDEKYAQLDPQQKRQRTFEAIRDLLVRESQDRPLLLALEDLHWIDRPSRDFLDFFTETVSDAAILLILLYRPEYSRSPGSGPHFHEIALDQLSARKGSELVQAILKEGEVVPELRELILGRAGGNPLFVEELTQSLIENGSIRRKDNQYVLARKAVDIEVPDTIQGIIAARMDRLEESLKQIIQVASVIGREFAYRILATITGMTEELKASLLNLQGLEFIYEKQIFPELEYIFKHALTQEVAYNSLLLTRRRELHQKIGKAIEKVHADRLEEHYELLAFHYVQSNNKQKAIEYLDLANRNAAKANAPEDAKGYFDKAMELLDTLPDTEENCERRISLLPNQSNVFWKLLKGAEYYDLLTRYEPVAARSRNPGLRGTFYARMGLNESMLGHLDLGIQNLTKALGLLETAGDAEETGIAYYSLAVCHFLKCDYDRGFQCNEEYLRTMGERFHLGSYVRLTGMVAQACAQLGRWDEAVEFAKKALSVAQEYSDDSSTAQVECVFAAIYTYKRDLDQAIEYAERAVHTASTPADKASAEAFLAWPLCHAGEPGRGIEVLTGIVPIFKAVRLKWWELWGTFFLADGYFLAGEHEKGKQSAEELLAIAEGCGARYFIGYAHFLLGELSLENDPGQAATFFEKSIAVFQEIKAENVLGMAHAGYGRLHKQQGNTVQARAYLTMALEIFERLGTLIEPDKVRKELAELPQQG